MVKTIRVIGFRIPSVEAVITEVEPVVVNGEPNLPETVRQAVLMLLLNEEGHVDDGYQYVCALDHKGRVISRVDRIHSGFEDGEPYDPDFELTMAPTGDLYSVLFVRVRNDELVYATVRAAQPRAAGEYAVRYGEQLFGVFSDLQFVAVLSLDGTVVHVAENWGV